MKPIEADCLAMIIEYASDFFGERVRVIGRNPDFTDIDSDYDGEWFIDLPKVAGDGKAAPSNCWSADTCQLMRIDDPDLQKQIESEQELVHE